MQFVFANEIDETILIWSVNHPNLGTYRMRSSLLYILIDAKGLSSTHRKEEKWEKEEARGTERITLPGKIFFAFYRYLTIRNFDCICNLLGL